MASTASNADAKYSPSPIVDVISKVRSGDADPDPDPICTSHIERQNLTMRMQMRRFTRLTNAFSKKLMHLKAACALRFAHYNFVRVLLPSESPPRWPPELLPTFGTREL
jgi:hypothetical protein